LGKVLAEANRRWGLENPHFLIGLGDSAVSDMGVGMLTALGYRFLDESGNQLPADATALSRIHRWLRPEAPVGASPITVLCDVVNPLCGPLGSARIFSGQKGADESQIHLIEAGMENFAREIARSGRDWREVPMTGAAGGLGAAFAAFLGAKLVPGAESLLAWIGFDKILAEHQIVITGEGRTDAQTLSGKTPLACCDRAERNRKWNLILSGQLAAGISLGRSRTRLAGIHECGALPSAEEALRRKTREIFSDPAFLERIQRD
jgi:glycerate kinase